MDEIQHCTMLSARRKQLKPKQLTFHFQSSRRSHCRQKSNMLKKRKENILIIKSPGQAFGSTQGKSTDLSVCLLFKKMFQICSAHEHKKNTNFWEKTFVDKQHQFIFNNFIHYSLVTVRTQLCYCVWNFCFMNRHCRNKSWFKVFSTDFLTPLALCFFPPTQPILYSFERRQATSGRTSPCSSSVVVRGTFLLLGSFKYWSFIQSERSNKCSKEALCM